MYTYMIHNYTIYIHPQIHTYIQLPFSKPRFSIQTCFSSRRLMENRWGHLTHRFASSLWACFPEYSVSVLVSSLVMTSWEMSIRLQRRSEMVCFACSTAAIGSLRRNRNSYCTMVTLHYNITLHFYCITLWLHYITIWLHHMINPQVESTLYSN